MDAARAQRHANADFIGSLSDRVGNDTIESNRGEYKRKNGKPRKER